MASVRLADYRPAPCLIAQTELQVRLYADHTLVACTLRLEPNRWRLQEQRALGGDELLLRYRRITAPEPVPAPSPRSRCP